MASFLSDDDKRWFSEQISGLATRGDFQSLERLFLETKESLESEMRSGFAEVTTRFDTQAARLERHAGLLQTGNRWVSRLNDWSEKIDRALEAKEQQIADLSKRIAHLEARLGGAA